MGLFTSDNAKRTAHNPSEHFHPGKKVHMTGEQNITVAVDIERGHNLPFPFFAQDRATFHDVTLGAEPCRVNGQAVSLRVFQVAEEIYKIL